MNVVVGGEQKIVRGLLPGRWSKWRRGFRFVTNEGTAAGAPARTNVCLEVLPPGGQSGGRFVRRKLISSEVKERQPGHREVPAERYPFDQVLSCYLFCRAPRCRTGQAALMRGGRIPTSPRETSTVERHPFEARPGIEPEGHALCRRGVPPGTPPGQRKAGSRVRLPLRSFVSAALSCAQRPRLDRAVTRTALRGPSHPTRSTGVSPLPGKDCYTPGQTSTDDDASPLRIHRQSGSSACPASHA